MSHPLNVQVLEPEGRARATVVFGHGYGCDQSMWLDVVPRLADTRRVLFDWPGAGQSAPHAYEPARHAGLGGYADDLLALLDDLDLEDVVFVGHSVGASIAMIAAHRSPGRFGQLAMLTPSACFENHPPDYVGGFEREQLEGLINSLAESQAAWSRAMAPVLMGENADPALVARMTESFCAMDPTIALRWARAAFMVDLRALASEVPVPSVVMQCRNDALAPEVVGQWLARNLPTSRYERLDAVGHCPHLSAPVEVAEVIDRCLLWRG